MIIVLHINVTLFLRICVHVVCMPTMNLFNFQNNSYMFRIIIS